MSMPVKYYKIVRLCLRAKNDSEEEKREIIFNLSQKAYEKSKTTLNESELIRILVHLNEVKVKEYNNPKLRYETDKNGYTFINDLITLKFMDDEAISKYKRLSESGSIITLNIAHPDTGGAKTIKYKRLCCGAGNARECKAYYIEESLFNTVNEILLCGLPIDMPFEIPAKFNAYFALPATDSWKLENTPNIVVIKDFEKTVREKYDNVIKQDKEWIIQKDFEFDFPIMPFDGAGIVSVEMAQKWADEFELDYIPASFQIRAAAGLKGNLYTFDILRFAKTFDVRKIVDVWDKEWDLFDDKIDCILTKSQFKFFQKGLSGGYSSLEEWKENFNKGCNGYKYTFNISAFSKCYKELRNRTTTAYQSLQTLNLNDEEIATLCQNTVDDIKRIHSNLDDFLKYRGLCDDDESNKEEKKKSSPCPPFYQALKENRALVNDPFIKQRIIDDIKRYKHKAYLGKLWIQGNFQIFTPDIFALAQFAFGMNVVGLLPAYTVYSNYWSRKRINNKRVNEIDIIRFPHISMEHVVTSVANNQTPYYDAMKIWYKYQDTGILTSMYDSLAQRLGTADFDGDQVCSTSNQVLIDAAKRGKTNTIISVTEEEAKPKKRRKPVKIPHINDISKIITADCRGMSCNIGTVVDKITMLWQCVSGKNSDIVHDYIKIMSIIGGLTIDFAKSGKKERIPKNINEYVKQLKKPYFLQYKDEDELASEKEIIKNGLLLGMTNDEIRDEKRYLDSDCTMNRICHYMEGQVDNLKLEFVHDEKFGFEGLVYDINRNCRNETYKDIKKSLIALHSDLMALKRKYNMNWNDDDYNSFQEYTSFYAYCRLNLIEIAHRGKFGGTENTINALLDYLLILCYTDKEIKDGCKYILWNAFNKEMVKRCKGSFKTGKIKNYNKLSELKAREQDKYKKIIQDKNSVFEFPAHEPFSIKREEIQYIRSISRECKMKIPAKVYLTCLAICRMKNVDSFELVYNTKIPDEVNRNKIVRLANLTRLDQVNKSLNMLQDKKVLELSKEESKKGSVLIHLPEIEIENSIGCFMISDINISIPYINEWYFRN